MEAVKTTKSSKRKKETTLLGHGVGRRKSSVARIWLSSGKGECIINNKPLAEYFDTELTRMNALTPITVLSNGSYDVRGNILGGGKNSQSDAFKLGLARALLAYDDSLRSLFKKYKLLTVDSRLKERKKYGQRGARRKFQFVKR